MFKVLKRTALILLLILVLLCGATVALMFRQTETITNTLEPARVDCVVNEDNGTTSGTRYTNTKSSIKVQNTGNIDAYIRVRFVSYWVDAEGNIAPMASPTLSIPCDVNTWIAGSENTYYCKTAVKPTELTPELLESSISLRTTTVSGKTYYQVLEVFADAIQSIPAEAVTDSWKVTVTNGVITAVN